MDVAIYISISILIIVLLLLVSLLTRSRPTKPAAEQPDDVRAQGQGQPAALRQPAGPRQQSGPRAGVRTEGGIRRREPRRRMVRGRNDDDSDNYDDDYVYGDEEEEGNDLFDSIGQPDGKIGAKKMRKLQEKAEKKQNREVVEQERVEKKQRQSEREEMRIIEDNRRKKEDSAKAEEERLEKEEQERKEHEEYLKMKAMFSVDEEGENDLDADLTSGSLLQEFIAYVKEMKVVILEDLAAHFKIKTQDAIDRIMTLQETGDLTGVIDDRGKFIYITLPELESVAKFIRQRGRVAISELAESSNRLINLNPDNMDTTRRLYTQIAS